MAIKGTKSTIDRPRRPASQKTSLSSTCPHLQDHHPHHTIRLLPLPPLLLRKIKVIPARAVYRLTMYLPATNSIQPCHKLIRGERWLVCLDFFYRYTLFIYYDYYSMSLYFGYFGSHMKSRTRDSTSVVWLILASPDSRAFLATAVATSMLTLRASSISGSKLCVISLACAADEHSLIAETPANIISSVQCLARLTMHPSPIPGKANELLHSATWYFLPFTSTGSKGEPVVMIALPLVYIIPLLSNGFAINLSVQSITQRRM